MFPALTARRAGAASAAMGVLACMLTLMLLAGCERDAGDTDETAATGESATAQNAAEDEDAAAGGGMAAADGSTPDDADAAGTPIEDALGSMADTPGRQAVAVLEPTEGHSARGEVTFSVVAGHMQIDAVLRDLPSGPHGLHIHEIGDCSAPDASSAGGHFAPDADPHGAPSDPAGEHHAGDLGNVIADDQGRADRSMADLELTFEGEYGVLGRAVVLHQGRDDLTSQPSGAAGPRIACGVIEETSAEDSD